MTAITLHSETGHRRLLADRLGHAAGIALAAMPLAMTVANRSGPLVITLAAACALAAAALDGGLPTLIERAGAALRSPLGLAGLAFLAWSLASVWWSGAVGPSLHAYGEFALPVGAAFVLALALPGRVPRRVAWLLAAGTALACALVLIELRTGLAVRRALGIRANSYIFNRSVLTILVLAAPLVALLRSGPRFETVTAGLALAGLITLAIVDSDSGAAVLGLVAGIVAYAVCRLAPRIALALAAAGLVAAFALAPVFGPLADRVLPKSVYSELAESHSRDRVDIWQSFDAAVREDPWIGAGFGMTARLDRAPVAARVAPEFRTLLAVGHPHDAIIQIWAELGVVGAVLALAVLLLGLRSLAEWPARRLAPPFALLAAVVGISLVGHGAWQGWWPAAIGAAIVWFRVAQEREREQETMR